MHRHGYKGRKFGREKDQRNALIKGLAGSLIANESIETTLPKAKAVVPYTEKLITKAKRGSLHARRQVVASLHTVAAAHKLVDEIAPKLSSRSSGYFRIKKTTMRRGDNAQLAKVTFVDDLSAAIKPAAKPAAAKNAKETKPIAKKLPSKPKKKPAAKKEVAK